MRNESVTIVSKIRNRDLKSRSPSLPKRYSQSRTMDKDGSENNSYPNSPSIDDSTHYIEAVNGETSLTPAQQQESTRPTSIDQVASEKAMAPTQCLEQERGQSVANQVGVKQNNQKEKRDATNILRDLNSQLGTLRRQVEKEENPEPNQLAALDDIQRIVDHLYASALATSESRQNRDIDIIEEAVKNGQTVAAGEEFHQPRPLGDEVELQSTSVILTVEGNAGTARHYFNSDLWRYGGRSSIVQKPEWHTVDWIDLNTSHEHIEVRLHTGHTETSSCWSWRSDQDGIFRVLPEHIHILEMVCGYLNLAAGRELKAWVEGLFDTPGGFAAVSHSGWYLGHSFIKFADVDRYTNLYAEVAAAMIEPADVVEALTRVKGSRMSVEEVTEGPPTQDCATTAAFETNPPEDSLVKLPRAWGECKDGPCLCGDSLMVLDTTTDELQVRELGPGEEYLAISYVWTQHDETSLLSNIRRAIEVTGIRLVWVDRLCINQRCKKHKAKQIPRMREVYQEGYATVALIPDVAAELPRPLSSPTGILPRHNFFKLAGVFKSQMKLCAWRTRCWTWQEGLLGNRGYYVTQKQVLPARIVSDCLASVDRMADERQICIASGNMQSLGVYSLRCNIATWSQEISIGDLSDVGDRELSKYWLLPEVDTLASALTHTKRRTASRPEDEIYSVLGMLPRGKELEVIYDEPRNTILGRAANAGLVGAEILYSESVSVRNGESWAANDDASKHIGSIYELGYKSRKPVQIHDKGLETQFHRLDGVVGHYLDGLSWMLKLDNCEKEEIRCHINQDGLETLVESVDQILFLEEENRPGCFDKAVLVSGTGSNVIRLATGEVAIEPWMNVKTQVVSRVVG